MNHDEHSMLCGGIKYFIINTVIDTESHIVGMEFQTGNTGIVKSFDFIRRILSFRVDTSERRKTVSVPI